MPGRKQHNVYVVELEKAVLREQRFLKANPGCDSDAKCYYVGMTGLTPKERFKNHKAGYKSNKFVRKYGVRLCRKLYEQFNPMTYEDAQAKEVELARVLRELGHAVWQK
jgi:hypothetical protein